MLHGRKKQSRLLAATAETRRQLQSLKEIVEMMSERGRKQRRYQELGEILRHLSYHFWVERLSFLEELKIEGGAVIWVCTQYLRLAQRTTFISECLDF